jgi:hypothetical protein
MQRAMKATEGDFTIHVRDQDPAAVRFYQGLGFRKDCVEMRRHRGSAGNTWKT